MSLKNILNAATRDEDWKKLEVDKVVCNTIKVEQGLDNNICANIDDFIDAEDVYFVEGGIGAVITQFTCSAQLSYDTCRLVHISFRAGNFNAPLRGSAAGPIAGFSSAVIEFLLGEDISYPTTVLQVGSVSGQCYDPNNGQVAPVTGVFQKGGSDDIMRVRLYFTGDVSTVVADRALEINLSFKYCADPQ
jgi:hypothetical protein